MRFSCQCIVTRDRKSREGNKKRCRCNKLAKLRLYYKCANCERDPSDLSPQKSNNQRQQKEQIRGGKWENLHKWDELPDIAEDDGMNPIDYKKLVLQFGSLFIDKALLERFRTVTGHELHYFLRRGIVFSHRGLEVILDRHERQEPFFIYAGRGPSSASTHLGHWVNFTVAKWLSEVFDAYLLVMISDGNRLPKQTLHCLHSLSLYLDQCAKAF